MRIMAKGIVAIPILLLSAFVLILVDENLLPPMSVSTKVKTVEKHFFALPSEKVAKEWRAEAPVTLIQSGWADGDRMILGVDDSRFAKFIGSGMGVKVVRIEYDLPFTHILHRRTPSLLARNTRAVVTTGSGDEVVVEGIFRWK